MAYRIRPGYLPESLSPRTLVLHARFSLTARILSPPKMFLYRFPSQTIKEHENINKFYLFTLLREMFTCAGFLSQQYLFPGAFLSTWSAIYALASLAFIDLSKIVRILAGVLKMQHREDV